jgi:hypothetical protein
VVVYLPTHFEKDWPTLLPDCFAWFSHRQAFNATCVAMKQQIKKESKFNFKEVIVSALNSLIQIK